MARIRRLLIPPALASASVLALLAAAATVGSLQASPSSASSVQVGVISVCQVGCDHTTIQAAVDGAKAGDTIKVAAGTYDDLHARHGVTQVVYIGESVTLRGGYTPGSWDVSQPAANVTLVDAQGKGRGFYIGQAGTVTLQGFTVANGLGEGGGGGLCSLDTDLTLDTMTFHGNAAPGEDFAFGGGALVEQGELHVMDSVFESNWSKATKAGYGGGLAISDAPASVKETWFEENDAWHGAALSFAGSYGGRLPLTIVGASSWTTVEDEETGSQIVTT